MIAWLNELKEPGSYRTRKHNTTKSVLQTCYSLDYMASICLPVSRRLGVLPPISPWITQQHRTISLNTAINAALRSEKRGKRSSYRGLDRRQTPEKLIGAIKASQSNSELLSGQHSITAALKLQRRKLLKLYYDKDMSPKSKLERNLNEILKLARDARVEAIPLPRWDFERDAAASGRPNNVSLRRHHAHVALKSSS